ncbi:MAG: serine hydrolase [Deltaproteobacteria bacterium]|nr:serine hydrolase [Deltaproteobacteria bacterium]
MIYQKLSEILQQGVDNAVFSGASASYYFHNSGSLPISGNVFAGRIVKNGAFVDEHTLFDIASLTKLFTALATLRLVDNGVITLDTQVGDVVKLPACCTWNEFTFEKILSHETGLKAWVPFFEEIEPDIRGSKKAYEIILKKVFLEDVNLLSETEAVYSDLGFIGLGEILSRILDLPLDEIIKNFVTEPLRLNNTKYFPVGSLPSGDTSVSFASTEDCPWRNRVLTGEVHDDNCWTMGGVCGHAGLFSTAADICKFGTAWLDAINGKGIISRKLAQKAFSRRKSDRGLGFDLKSETGSSAGNSAGSNTVGHLGFTGTSLWIDPDKNAVISLLTNRVYPTRENSKIKEFRPRFHEAFFREL